MTKATIKLLTALKEGGFIIGTKVCKSDGSHICNTTEEFVNKLFDKQLLSGCSVIGISKKGLLQLNNHLSQCKQ